MEYRWISVAAIAFAFPAFAQTSVPLDTIVVTATRAARASFDLPVAIDVIDGETIRQGQSQVNLSETLARVPGVLAQNRQNYAQDLQIAMRGFGARTAFGVRGVRLVADGIPATMPDGQGQAASFDLGSARRIEVMRGPFSTLYGNAAGGVIQIFTEDGPVKPAIEGSVLAGSYGTHRVALKAGGEFRPGFGSLNTLINLARFETDGYRDHSAATRDTVNAKMRYDIGDTGTLTFIANALHQTDTQDPLGLSKTQYLANPRQADASALAFNTRKGISQQQAGLLFERALDDATSLRAMVYAGARRVGQYQAIPVAAQANPLSPGGVVDLDRSYGGVDLRLMYRMPIGGNAVTFTLGSNYDSLREQRTGFQNFIGPSLGIMGALRRDEDNRVSSFDQYLQVDWVLNANFSVLAGLRSSVVRFSITDHYVVGANPDDSGAVRYANTSPVAGAIYKVAPGFNVYANVGRGFETPTLNELAYRPGGLTGLNFALQASVSKQIEIGVKAAPDSGTRITAALFDSRVRDEIAVLTNAGGRSTFQNVGSSRRDGVELSASRVWGGGFSARFVYTHLSATYLDNFLTCTGSTCAAPLTPVQAGNRLPGVPRNNAYAEIAWRNAKGWFAAMEVRASGSVYVNDVNSDNAPGYAIANVRAGIEQSGTNWRLSEFVRFDNVSGRSYVGSVIVGEANGRYYEPAPTRSMMIGISASFSF